MAYEHIKYAAACAESFLLRHSLSKSAPQAIWNNSRQDPEQTEKEYIWTLPLLASQRATVLSVDALPRMAPSEEKATLETEQTWTLRVRRWVTSNSGNVETRQSFIVLQLPAEASKNAPSTEEGCWKPGEGALVDWSPQISPLIKLAIIQQNFD